MSIVVKKYIKIYKEQCLCIHYSINIRLFSRYDVETTQAKLIIHAWYARPTCQLPRKSHMANSIIFKF